MNAPHESNQRKKTIRLVVFGLAAVLVIGGIGVGVSYAWDSVNGPTKASAADCELAQQLFDKAGQVPSDKQQAKDFEKSIRETRYSKFENDGISTEVGWYVSWKVVKATGEGDRPTRAAYDEMVKNAKGHCREQRELVIPGFDF